MGASDGDLIVTSYIHTRTVLPPLMGPLLGDTSLTTPASRYVNEAVAVVVPYR